jgi:ADP-heptose:LPS heptosyltransferase
MDVMKRVLVIQMKRIGDVVLTAPALASLRRAVPGVEVTVVLAGACGELGPLLPCGEGVLVWRAGGLNAGLIGRVAGGRWDAVLDFTGSDRSALLSIVSGAGRRVCWEKFAGTWWRRRAWNERCGALVRELHTIDFHQALVRELVPEAESVGDAGHLRKPEGVPERLVSGDYVLLHPGTARAEKFWPAASWVEVLRHVRERHGMEVVVTGGEGVEEREQVREMAASGVAFTDLSGKLDLRGLAAVAAGCRLAVTVDTGVMHLAASWGRPQVALFGPTNPWHWGPRHGMARVLWGEGGSGLAEPRHRGVAMATLPAGRVCGAVDDLLRGPGGQPTLDGGGES